MPLQQTAVTNAVNALVNNFTSQRIAMPNGNYLGECTAPICWYLHYLGLPIPPMHNNRADGWGVANPSELQPYFTFEPYQPNKAYTYGSIFMWDSPHIAICIHSDGNNTATVFEQNADPDGSPCGTKTRTMANQWHKPTYVMIPRIDAAPELPYTITPVDPYKVDVIAGHQKWDLSHPDFASVAANPVLTLNQQTTITVNAELHHRHIADYTYLLEDPAVPQGYNRLDTVPYTPPAPTSNIKDFQPLTPVLATKYSLLTDVPYYSTSTNAQNAYKETGRLPVGEYYQISKDFGMLNLSTDNTKDLQHWVNPRDNVPLPPPLPEPTPEVIATPPTDESWKQLTSFNPNRKPIRYVMLQDYTVVDQAQMGKNRRIAKYTEMSIYGTFVKNGITYGLIHLAQDSGWRSYYGIPLKNADGSEPGIVELEQQLYSTETDVVTRQATKSLTVHDYEILLLDQVERVFKNIDGILPGRKKKK